MPAKKPALTVIEEDGRKWKGAEELVSLLVPIEEISLDPENLRSHNDKDIKTTAGSLKKYGQVEPLITRPDGRLIGGEGRLLAIKTDPKLGWTHVARTVFRGTEEEAKKLGILLNRTGELSGWDYEGLSKYLQAAIEAEEDVMDLGWTADEVDDLLASSGMIEEVEPEEEFSGGYAETEEETAARSKGATEVPEPLRQVLLVFSAQSEFIEFQANLGKLRSKYGIEQGGMTPVVVEAVRRAAGE